MRKEGVKNVLGLRCEPIEKVRIGFIGLGVRAKRAVLRMANIKGTDIKAICDLVESNISDTQHILASNNRAAAETFCSDEGWMRVCEHKDIDLIYICTDWLSHAKIALYAMECGKHVAIEVPAATTIEECWQLVDMAEQTQRHCIMLENCCYDEFELTALRMSQEGTLGEIIHCEGSYMHDLRERIVSNDGGERKWSNWQVEFMKSHNGNPYPTHGLGPIALAMGIHRGDRMSRIASMSSKRVSYGNCGSALVGNMNSSIVTTERGRTILIQHCISLPRPYSRSFLISGTKGFVQKYPMSHIVLDCCGEEALTGDNLNRILESYKHPIVSMYKQRGEELCGRRWIDYAMDSRLIHCLRNGLPLDMDVYDAAEWSSIVELSQLSADAGGTPIEIPDFTRGDWREFGKHEFYGL